MNPGKLSKRITVQQYQPTKDSYGAEVENWEDVCTVWADIQPLNGREYFAAETINSEITSKIKIRYRTDLNTKMRIIYKNRIFNIKSIINPNESNKELVLMVKEVV